MDGDGDFDLVLGRISSTGSGGGTELYTNDGTGLFTLAEIPSLGGVTLCFVARWADLNGDGRDDLFLARGLVDRPDPLSGMPDTGGADSIWMNAATTSLSSNGDSFYAWQGHGTLQANSAHSCHRSCHTLATHRAYLSQATASSVEIVALEVNAMPGAMSMIDVDGDGDLDIYVRRPQIEPLLAVPAPCRRFG